ncbi:DUF221-domain-containing protein [Saccharata proteae CBS 121410]|uniref:DUF221-domain-containing protein n=1 Tax=Saccharata proteae CBS 121410 TaxID=1314787 RepID=A0A6A5YB99_9PEZI|nr:DUF221-domain-containing protein [Saccharata proteae CBS 121410]
MDDDNSGSHRGSSPSLQALLSTIIPAVALAVLLLGTFLIIRRKLPRFYYPRTFIDTLRDDERTPKDPPTLMGWLRRFFFELEDWQILNRQSLDAYLNVRFFKVIVTICFIGCCIIWPVLLPINATGGGGQQELDILSFSNVKDPNRYWAHAIMAWAFFGFVMFMITRETVYLIHLRQAYLLCPWNSSKMSSRTVLFTSVPPSYRDEDRIRQLFDEVGQVWLVDNFEKMEKMVKERDESAFKLEAAEISLIKRINGKRLKAAKEITHTGKDRPKHRLTPLIGTKVDTISHTRNTINKLLPKLRSEQKEHLNHQRGHLGAVFVEFKSQRAAQAAYAMVALDHPENMIPRQTGILPYEIIWPHLRMTGWETTLRRVAATTLIALLIIFWGIPVAFVGTISNIQYLSEKYEWLHWLDNLSSTQLGVLTGLLPPLLLSAVVSLVPMICRFIAKEAGSVSSSHVELQTQIYYFAFSLIQVFLVTTFSSGITAVLGQIAREPTAAPILLASNLPKAANFYLSYFILYGVAISAVYVFNPQGLFFDVILPKLMHKTPREQFNDYTTLSGPSLGSEYAKWTNLAVIAISYSCVAPLVLGFAAVGFSFIYLAYRYNFHYVFHTNIDTKGAFYAQALQQLTVGVYIAELCLIGLFATRIRSAATANGPLILMVILLVATSLYHYLMRQTLKPLTELLPRNLLAESEADYNDRLEHETATSARVNDIAAHDTVRLNRNWFHSFFAPHTQSAAAIATSLNPSLRQPVPPYPAEIAKEAYTNPALVSEAPTLWLVKDRKAGDEGAGEDSISDREIRELKESLGEDSSLRVTNEGAWLNEKNKVVWDRERLREMPLWTGRIVY